MTRTGFEFSRLLGLIPLLFYLIKVQEYSQGGVLHDLLWVCNISNLLLGAAILLGWNRLIWICVLLLLAGTPPWLLYISFGGFLWTSVPTHFAAPIIGWWVLRQRGIRYRVWPEAMAICLILQLISLFATPFEANVNVVFQVEKFVRPYFTNFPAYWFLNNLGFIVSLIAAEWGLRFVTARFSSAPEVP